MGKVKWGVIVAIVAAIAAVVLATQGVFTTGGKSGETADSSETSVTDKPEPDALEPNALEPDAPEPDAPESDALEPDALEPDTPEPDTDDTAIADARGDTADADGGEAVGPGPEPDESEPRESAADDDSDRELHEEAESYVRQLAEPSDEPVPVESAEGFVGPDRPLAPAATDSGTPGTTLPEAEEIEEVEVTGAAVAEAGAVSSAQAESPDAGPESVRQSEAAVAGTADTPDTDARDSGTETVHQPEVDLPLTEQAPVTIAELLGAEEAIASDAVFYVHTVQPEDVQGIWGIVHNGIVENFAAGIAVHRGESTETYRVDIPPHADERKPDSTSSFLGKVIHEKTQKSYVYNYQTDRLGKNPDLIIPGQEIVIVSFTPEELIEIYKHFVREGERETRAMIGD